MNLNVRRVVTGHDEQGRSTVAIDQISDKVISRRPGHASTVIWTTAAFPCDNNDAFDGAQRQVGTAHPDGTVFRIVRYDPGVAGRMHRTESLDYAVVLSGEIDMELDLQTVTLRAGDVVVQRGTVHNWINRGTEPCVMAFVLVAALPVAIAGQSLPAVG